MKERRQPLSKGKRREQLILRELKKRYKMLKESVGEDDEEIPSREIIHAIRTAGVWPRLTEGQVAVAVMAFTNRMVYEEVNDAYYHMFY